MTFKLFAFMQGMTPITPIYQLKPNTPDCDSGTQLFISSSKIKSCKDVFDTLKALNIDCKIVSNETLHNNNYEKGCEITFTNLKPTPSVLYKVWSPLQTTYSLDCAHLHIPNVYSGCLLRYLSL